MKCLKCDAELQPEEVTLTYLGYDMTYTLPRCPKCRDVFIPEDIARGKMKEIEACLEDK